MRVAKYDRVNDKLLGYVSVSDEQWQKRCRTKSHVLLQINENSASYDASVETKSTSMSASGVPAPPEAVPDEARWDIVHAVSDKSVTDIKSEWKRRVLVQRDAVATAGIEWTYGTNTYVVQTDTDSQLALAGAVVSLNQSGAASRTWRMLSNEVVDILAADFKDMAQSVHDHIDACYVRQAELEALIDSPTNDTAAKVKAIDVNSGWPAHYGGA